MDAVLLTRNDVIATLNAEECIAAVEKAFTLYGEGKTPPPGILGVHATDGGFHIKAGLMDLGRSYFAAKTNANFPQNRKLGLQTIQGVIILCDGENGQLLSVMDSMEITILRTGAATAVAAKYLSRPDSKVITICGCGNQGRISLKMISQIRPVEKAFAWDLDNERSSKFARELSEELQSDVSAVTDFSEAASESDIIITCTPTKQFFLRREVVSPGTFIAAVGADSDEKQELEPQLLSESKVVTDITAQSAAIGELHHAIESGTMSVTNVYAELGEIVAGKKPGRESEGEIIVFDSTGMALQDVVSAVAVYEKALKTGVGKRIDFGS